MNDARQGYPDHPPHGSGAPSRRTELLRAGADGELQERDRHELAEHLATHPGDAAVIEFERRLRTELARAAAEDEPPADLRARVERIAAPPRPKRLAWRLAAAAALLLGAGTWWWTSSLPPLPTGTQLVVPSHRSSVVSFVRAQHDDCTVYQDLIAGRFRLADPAHDPSALVSILGRAPTLGDLDAAGVRFLGAARCAVPGRGASVHLVLDASASSAGSPDPEALVSLFVQQDRGEFAVEPGLTYRIAQTTTASRPGGVYLWRRDGLLYVLVSNGMPSLEAARLALGQGAASAEL